MIPREQILQLIRMKGPVIPSDISKQIGQNLMMTSAILSELSSNKELVVSNLKVGGTPLYYIPGQEARLQDFSQKLPANERQSYQLLREKKLLKDRDLDARMRLGLRNIKDFAIPLQVTINGEDSIFWKWYLTPNADAEHQIKIHLGVVEETAAAPIESPLPEPTPEPPAQETPPATPKVQPPKIPKPLATPKPKSPPVRTPLPPKAPEAAPPKKTETQQTTIPHTLTTPSSIEDDFASIAKGFLKSVYDHFKEKHIHITHFEIIKKTSEVDFTILLPTAVGSIPYYCKAKSKKRLNEGDLSQTFVQGQIKKLPSMLISNGELTKKAQALLEHDLQGVYFTKI